MEKEKSEPTEFSIDEGMLRKEQEEIGRINSMEPKLIKTIGQKAVFRVLHHDIERMIEQEMREKAYNRILPQRIYTAENWNKILDVINDKKNYVASVRPEFIKEIYAFSKNKKIQLSRELELAQRDNDIYFFSEGLLCCNRDNVLRKMSEQVRISGPVLDLYQIVNGEQHLHEPYSHDSSEEFRYIDLERKNIFLLNLQPESLQRAKDLTTGKEQPDSPFNVQDIHLPDSWKYGGCNDIVLHLAKIKTYGKLDKIVSFSHIDVVERTERTVDQYRFNLW